MPDEAYDAAEEELGLGGVLRILLEYKWPLIGITLLVGVILVGYTLLMNNVYESSALLIIRVPEVPITGEASPLSIEMLRQLAESTDVKREVFDELQKKQMLEQDVLFRGFQDRLEAKDEGSVRGLSPEESIPMMRLVARSKSSELAASIANTWAAIVVARSKKTYAEQIGDTGGFMKSVSERANTALLETEENYTETLLAANLAMNKASLTQEEKVYGQQYAELLKLIDQHHSKEAVLKAYQSQLDQAHTDGIWIGDVYWNAFRKGEKLSVEAVAVENLGLYRTAQGLIRNEKALAEFEKTSRIQFKQMQLTVMQQQLLQIAEGMVSAQDELSEAEKKQSVIADELTRIPEKIVLGKALTDDVLFEAALADTLKDRNNFPSLKSEEINAAYWDLKKSLVETSANIEGSKSRIKYYSKEEQSIQEKVTVLSGELAAMQAQKETLTQIIQSNIEMMHHMRKVYYDLRKSCETTRNELMQLDVQIKSRQSELDSRRQKIQELEKNVFSREQELTALNRKVEDLRQVRSSISAKAGEITLLYGIAEQTSRSGPTILYPAQADPLKVAPARTKIVIKGMAIAFGLLLLLFVLMRVIRKN